VLNIILWNFTLIGFHLFLQKIYREFLLQQCRAFVLLVSEYTVNGLSLPFALDPVAEYDIYRQFNTLVGGKTAIYISRRLSSCKFCDRIAVFAEDTIKEYGTQDELAERSGGIYAEMFKAQAQYYVDCGM